MSSTSSACCVDSLPVDTTAWATAVVGAGSCDTLFFFLTTLFFFTSPPSTLPSLVAAVSTFFDAALVPLAA